VDAVVGVGWWTTKATSGAIRVGLRVSRPVVELALDPPLVPASLAPRRLLGRLSVTVHEERVEAVQSISAVSGPRTLGAVLDRVDLTAVVDEVLSRLDLNALVLRHLDVGALAEAVVEAVDLPQIVRQSSGSIASETIESVRLQGLAADRAVERIVDRLLMRPPAEGR
jgi:hypothetical protein